MNENEQYCLKNKSLCENNNASQICLENRYQGQENLSFREEMSEKCDELKLNHYSFNKLDQGKKE